MRKQNMTETKAYTVYRGWTRDHGKIVVDWYTNDNLDYGISSEYASRRYTLANRQQFDRVCGKSRTGCGGTRVEVYLDGKKI